MAEKPKDPGQILSVPDTNGNNTWTGLNTFFNLIANTLRLPVGAVVGSVLTAQDGAGRLGWTDKAPSQGTELTGQTISSSTTIVTAAAGEYLVGWYLECTTSGAAGVVDIQFQYTDDVGLTTPPTLGTLTLTATGRLSGVTFLRCSGGGIDLILTVTGAVGGPIFSCYVDLVRVG